tara:strand:- start:61 stop:387 length:327 start_codon:yes stop_codon:yes gene_type:complete
MSAFFKTRLHWITRCPDIAHLKWHIKKREEDIRKLEKEAEEYPEQSYENPARFERWEEEIGIAVNAVRLCKQRITALEKGADQFPVAQQIGFPDDFYLDDEFYGDDDY